MRKLCVFLTVVVFLFGCGSIINNINKGTPTDQDSVIVVGKISFDPPILQKKGGTSIGMVDTFYSYYTFDPNKKPHTIADAIAGVKHYSPGYREYYYFIVKLPRKAREMYLTAVHAFPEIIGNGSTHLEMFPKLLIPWKPEDRFIYIGNIVFRMDGKTVAMEIGDQYDNVKKRFHGYVLDKNGRPVEPVKRLVKPVGRLTGTSTSVRYHVHYNWK